MYVIIDIDGTVADNKHRAHYVEGTQKDWDNFFRADLVLKDTLIPGVMEALQRFQELKYELIFVTGRHEPLRDATMRWLHEKLGIDTDDGNLLMRPAGNMLDAAAYKREQVMTLKRERHNTGRGFLFIDDDLKVLPMFAEHGIAMKAPECWTILFPKPKAES
jgi:hydroxymethylpyrimidine pyrophosphatase-like HAD family hydrolase